MQSLGTSKWPLYVRSGQCHSRVYKSVSEQPWQSQNISPTVKKIFTLNISPRQCIFPSLPKHIHEQLQFRQMQVETIWLWAGWWIDMQDLTNFFPFFRNVGNWQMSTFLLSLNRKLSANVTWWDIDDHFLHSTLLIEHTTSEQREGREKRTLL